MKLELGDLIDEVDQVQALDAVAVTLIHGIHPAHSLAGRSCGASRAGRPRLRAVTVSAVRASGRELFVAVLRAAA